LQIFFDLQAAARDAGEHIAALSKKETALPHWQLAAQCLLAAVEKGGGLIMMAA
jgi:hypothetical protein